MHRDVKPENVIIFDADFHKVKLIDFGMTRKCGSYVRRLIGSIPYSPPEVCTATNNDILVSTSMDVWAFGVLLFCSLTGKFLPRFSIYILLCFQVIFLGNMLKKLMFIIMSTFNGIDNIRSIVVFVCLRNGIDLRID